MGYGCGVHARDQYAQWRGPSVSFCRRCGTATEPRAPHPWCPTCQQFDWHNPAPAVGIVVTRGDEVLLAKRARPPRQGLWDLIGGFVEPGETVPEAARRETLEETGMHIEGLRRLHQAPGSYGPGEPTLNFIYAAEATGEPQADDDVEALGWFTLDALPELAWPHEADALQRLAEARTGAYRPHP